MNSERGSLIGTLATLRALAVLGQVLAIVAVVRGLGVPLPVWPMAAAIGVLGVFELYALRRARDPRAALPAEVFGHITVDVAVLAFLIGCSGGPANPFTSLFLLPIAFAALELPQRWIYATALLCGVGYALAAACGLPLPHVHGLDGFDLHLWGMAVNFILSAAVFAYFLARMAAQRRERDTELARLRERFARDEGILALATHAASVAHELNTPLATMLLALEDLQDQSLPGEVGAELAMLRTLAETCRDRVRELARAARRGEGVDPEQVVSRWTLLRPAVALERVACLPSGTRVEAGIGHLLRALLDNAADASLAAGSGRVCLSLQREGENLVGIIRDQGRGFDPDHAFLPGTRFVSDKPGGMGVGLALSHAVIERLGGELTMQAAMGGGTRVAFRVPCLTED